MTEFDLIIRGGTVIDGSGGTPFCADVGIRDGKITSIGQITGSAKEEIDARGKLVTPGFVDIHTHYDGQAIWSDRLSPSSQHGVTTVVLGNCGVGFAPCRAEDHDMLVNVMEGVEDIPEIVMTSGLPWNWETFPEYLDVLERGERDIDVAAYLPHSPLRVYVMGERGANREPATADDLVHMQRLAVQALKAGALGFATSRLSVHRTGQGAFIPSFSAANGELMAIGEAMAASGGGLLQVVTDIGDAFDQEIEFIAEFAGKTNCPVTFTLAQTNGAPDAWRKALRVVEQANRAGGKITAQIFPRPIGLVLGLDTTVNPFSLSPTYVAELAGLPMQERIARMREPAMKARLLAEQPHEPSVPLYAMSRDFIRIFPLDSAADYDPEPKDSISALAESAGREPLDYMYDRLLEKGGYTLFYAALANLAEGSLAATREMIMHPNTVMALGDGGAHYGVVCDSGYPTFVLSHWTRDRRSEKLSVPYAVKALSRDPALVVGLGDRGLVAEGYKADVNILDYDKLSIDPPHMVADLPGGGRRLMQEANGYLATIVSGTPIQRNGRPTGALPGKLVRGKQPAPARLAAV